ncbi:MAG: carboxypeptidase-like regulatory domain-containing protein [Bacteroidales bacterium]
MGAQILEGEIRSADHGEAVSHATVFIDGTFTGTTCDSAGQFRLDVSEHPRKPVIIQALGYKTLVVPWEGRPNFLR